MNQEGHSDDFSTVKPGRNDPCPCGSGRKYKKCCGAASVAAHRVPDLRQLFMEAEREHRAGRLERAEPLYSLILASDPCHADALHMQGVLAAQKGQYAQAVDLIRKAISFEGDFAPYHSNLGVALQGLGQTEEAIAAYRRALRLMPDYGDALVNLGEILRQSGQFDEARVHLEKAVALNPASGAAQTSLGMVLHALGRPMDALTHVQKSIELAPSSLDGIIRCARTLTEVEQWSQALPYFKRWTAIEPQNFLAQLGLGDCYERQGYRREAAAYYWKALELKPDCVEAANNLGVCLTDGCHPAAALELFRKAVESKPDYTDAWTNLGVTMKSFGQLETALRCLNMALSLKPGLAQALWNRSLCLLAMGRLAEGWADYDWRWKAEFGREERPCVQPRWEGSDPRGKTILVWMEQGLGDQIAFSSLLPDLVRAGARCVVECEWRLTSLFARSFPEVEIAKASWPPQPRTLQPDIDFHIPAGSLARYFRPTLKSFPQHRGYLIPDPSQVDCWKERTKALGEGLKVGICWRSGMTSHGRANLYSKLSQWGPILTTPGVHFVNLQYDRCDEELREAERLFGRRIHIWDGFDLKNDQEGVAALISSLDLVISAATAVDQMAGAVGMPTWVLTRGINDWWDFGTGRCPWYPSVRAFYCGANDPWEPVIEKMGTALRQLAEAQSGALRTPVEV